MKLLALDTSTSDASIALQIEDKITVLTQPTVLQHAKLLLPMIDQLMIEANIKIHDLDGIVFGQGPGSFTGIRIACSVAKGLAYTCDLPLYPISGLEAIAYSARQQLKDPFAQVIAIIDARMNEVYWANYNHLTAAVDVVSPISNILLPTTPFYIAGVGYNEYISQCPDLIELAVQQFEIYPTAKAMLGLVTQNIMLPVSVEAAAPVYIRNQVTHRGAHG